MSGMHGVGACWNKYRYSFFFSGPTFFILVKNPSAIWKDFAQRPTDLSLTYRKAMCDAPISISHAMRPCELVIFCNQMLVIGHSLRSNGAFATSFTLPTDAICRERWDSLISLLGAVMEEIVTSLGNFLFHTRFDNLVAIQVLRSSTLGYAGSFHSIFLFFWVFIHRIKIHVLFFCLWTDNFLFTFLDFQPQRQLWFSLGPWFGTRARSMN